MNALYETIPVEFDCARCASGDKGAELLRRFDALRPLQTFVLVTREEPTSLLQRLQEAFDAWGAGDSASAKAAFALFAHGLRRHIGVEEALLFPEYERRNGTASDSGATAALRTEHRQILALVAAIELGIRNDVLPVPLLRTHLRDVLRAHNRNEEDTLYPVTDGLIEPAECDVLLRGIQLFHEVGRDGASSCQRVEIK